MKKTKLWIICEILKYLFYGAVPIGLFIWKCTSVGQVDGGTKFILGCSGYILLIILYFIIKKLLVKDFVAKLKIKTANLETQIETETDQTKIPLIEKSLGTNLILNNCFNIIPIALCFGLLLLVTKALENSLITMCSVLGLSMLSIVLGFICTIIQAKNITSKNKQ